MPSIQKDYNYDIFISYRQKDNKYDGWVTEFAENLKRELDATFKEEVSVYLDINPYDGILDTYNVNASLREKLKCLVFIPIISQTYCDPKSFAWQNEFVAFNGMVKTDLIGREVKLENGNIASRILPVKIHELDKNDLQLIEDELGSALRSVDFIFRSPGVNRPLKTDDSRTENLNHTYYRDQINKVANAIKEIISALRLYDQKVGGTKEVFNHTGILQKSRNTKIIVGTLSFLALLIFVYFLIQTLSKSKDQPEKSIAVLPFRNDSPNDSTTYFINGIMEEVNNKLERIKDFRVLSRYSVEQYRNNTNKSTPEIAKELGVNYIVEGSGQKYGKIFRLRVQLIKAAKEGHLWGDSYEKEINETKDIFDTQSEIAQSIATALKVTMTPGENQQIEKTPTTSLTALDFYQRGRDEYAKYLFDNKNTTSLKKAEDHYHRALKFDSTFAQAYAGLARVFWDLHSSEEEYFSANYMDSVLILCNKALLLDDKSAEAYTILGDYFSFKGNIQKAIDQYNKALTINPNFPEAYLGKGFLYGQDDYINSIDNFRKAATLIHGLELPELLRTISTEYISAGFIDKARYYNIEALNLDGDSAKYYDFLGFEELLQGNFEKALKFLQGGYAMDSSSLDLANDLAYTYMFQNKFRLSLKYLQKNLDTLNFHRNFIIAQVHHIGWAFWKNGQKKKAEYYFNKQLEYSKNEILMKRPWGQKLYPYYDMAGVYAFNGDKEMAYKCLKQFNMRKTMPFWIQIYMKSDPLFNSIRGEAAFQQIAKEIENKYLAEHKRVEKWLKENNML